MSEHKLTDIILKNIDGKNYVVAVCGCGDKEELEVKHSYLRIAEAWFKNHSKEISEPKKDTSSKKHKKSKRHQKKENNDDEPNTSQESVDENVEELLDIDDVEDSE